MTEENLDDEIEKLEEELKKIDGKGSSYGSPKELSKDSLFKFFSTILSMEDTTRIGNLTNPEVGITKLGVRDYQELAAYAEAEGLDVVKDYLMNKSKIITSTSMSRKGFWPQLFVTQIKKEQKLKEPTKEKKKWFGKEKKEE